MWHQPFTTLRQQLTPIPTGVEKQLTPLNNIKAVLWDIYGTLIISASGDVGSADSNPRATAFLEAHAALDISLSVSGQEGLTLYQQTIHQHQQSVRDSGIKYPEIDIVAVWKSVHRTLGLTQLNQDPEFQLLAAEFEARANPTWPMPGAPEIIKHCRTYGAELGIISNAQFFTQALFDIYFGQSLETLGFAAALQIYSYQHSQAKPGTYLFQVAARKLQERSIMPAEVLYVGNDRRNDIWPAQRIGFRTGLFAGDQRSYRPRLDDSDLKQVQPDIVLTELMDLQQVLL